MGQLRMCLIRPALPLGWNLGALHFLHLAKGLVAFGPFCPKGGSLSNFFHNLEALLPLGGSLGAAEVFVEASFTSSTSVSAADMPYERFDT